MRLLAFAASARRESYNVRLLSRTVQIARDAGAEVDVASFCEFDMPLYNEDARQEQGFPPGAEELKRRIEGVDGFVLASPEYNFSIPGTLKNAIDWTSRYQPPPWRGKPGLLLSASPSLVGGNRGLWQVRVPLECLGAPLWPDMFSLARANDAFLSNGQLQEEALEKRLQQLVQHFVAHVDRAFARS